MVVLAAFAFGACTADKANPILPSTGSSNGWVASGTYDAQMDVTADSATDGYADLSVGDSASRICDLLKQDCPPGQGCYPDAATDSGSCQEAGGVSTLNMIPIDPDVRCLPGLACIPAQGLAGMCECLPICDKDNPACGNVSACITLPAFPAASRFGYCAQT